MLVEQSVASYVAELASGKPAPGGGSAAALVGALGAALASMVANLTVGRERYRTAEHAMQDLLRAAARLQAELLDLVDVDAQVYERVAAAYRLPRTTEAEQQARTAAIQLALKEATDVPLRIARACADVVTLCPTAATMGNPTAVTDVGAAALVAEAALEAALLNVEINLRSIRDAEYVELVQQEMAEDRDRTRSAREQTMAVLRRALEG